MSPVTPGATTAGAEQQRWQRPVALVTGASRGIGRQAALVLARAGYDVAFTARTVDEGSGTVAARSSDEQQGEYTVSGSLRTTEHEIEAIGVRALPVRMDLLDAADVRAAAERVIGKWARIDVLVNNAVAHLRGSHDRFLELDVDVARDAVAGNYLNQVALMQTVLPAMLERGRGTIVNICSGSSMTDPPAPPGEGGWGVAYSASKAAFGRLAGAINAEFRSRGIRAYNLDPGFVVTDSGKARGGTNTIAERGFATTPEDLPGAVIAWLAQSPDAEQYLGRMIQAPKLAAKLELQPTAPPVVTAD